MLLIECPYCGKRNECEFHYGGEAHISRPPDPDAVTDAEWADYLFLRTNPKGWHRERWYHLYGCRKWFNVLRHTLTHTIAATYPINAPQPAIPQKVSQKTTQQAQPLSHTPQAAEALALNVKPDVN